MSCNFYSGFSLQNEEVLFKDYRVDNDFTLSGFSYGAIQAFENALQTSKRVDLLQLFSPAFFQDKQIKYKRMQLLYFKKDATSYCESFLQNITYPKTMDMIAYFNQGTYEELETLLYYEWSKEKLQTLKNKGTKIEVYLGSDDKIINSQKAKDFFVEFSTVYYLKKRGHIL